MSLTTQFYTMIAMIGMGSWLGAALDTYGRFLKRPSRAHWVVFLNDILFWFIQGLIVFYILLLVNQGELRFYVFIALLCGYATYRSLLQSIYKRTLERAIQFTIATYRFLARTFQLLVIKPLKALFQLVVAILIGILKLLQLICKVLYSILKVVVKIVFTPIKWIGLLIWRFLPVSSKQFMLNIYWKLAGFIKKVENMKHIFYKLWKKIRKS